MTADTTTQSAAVHGAALPFARYGLRGTVAARFWIYQRREPVSVIYWGIVVVIMAATSVSTIRTPAYHVALILSAVLGAAFVGIFRANTIGLTGPGFGLEAMALSGRRACARTSPARTSPSASSRCRCSPRSRSAWPRWPGIRWTGSWPGGGPGRHRRGAWALANIFTAALAYPAEKRAGNPTPRPASGYMGYSLGGNARQPDRRGVRSPR